MVCKETNWHEQLQIGTKLVTNACPGKFPTRLFSFQLILLLHLLCDVDHGVEIEILEDEGLE